jgi:peptide/nickel transport system substrate-binding protein
MRRFNLLLLAASSVVWAVAAQAATRPHYGGTLRVAMREAPQAADPANLVQIGAANISRLIFDTLVVLGERGQPQASLATEWHAEPGDQRWRFSLRGGVSFSDGAAMNAAAVAASLRAANPEWKVIATGDTLIVETDVPHPDMPAELALAKNAIAQGGGHQPSGTGPFTVAQWLPGKHVTLTANDQYWGGGPFLDAIDVDFGKNDREQLTEFDLGRIDIAEVAPENIRRARADGRSVATSSPSELLALVFSAAPRSEEETHARNALALSIDAAAINNVVLQGGGEPAGALLPNWLSGYAFVFSQQTNPDRARQERALAKQSASFVLEYNALDSVAHTIAERILLNARDAGIALQLTTSGRSDMTLTRIPIASANGAIALVELAKALQLSPPKLAGDSASELYSAEKALLQSRQVIPLIHLREGAAVRPAVRNFAVRPDGSWQMQNVWLAEKP